MRVSSFPGSPVSTTGMSVWDRGSRPGGGHPETTTPSGHAQPGAASRADLWSWDQQEMPTVHHRGSAVARHSHYCGNRPWHTPRRKDRHWFGEMAEGSPRTPRRAGRRVGRPPGGPRPKQGRQELARTPAVLRDTSLQPRCKHPAALRSIPLDALQHPTQIGRVLTAGCGHPLPQGGRPGRGANFIHL